MTVRQRGQLPKAYLRFDPNIDQTHPDNLDGFIRLLCAANRQPVRGTFRDRAVLDSLFGKTGTDRLYRRRDVLDQPDGSVEVPGWRTWQEGDMTVSERMSRYRQRIAAVTKDVTDTVTAPSPDRISTSDTLGQQGSKAVDALTGALPPPPDDSDEFDAVRWLSLHGCTLSETNGYYRKLVLLTTRFGSERVVGVFDRLVRAGILDGDVRGFIFGAEETLFPKADLKALEREDRAGDDAERFNRSVERTQREQARIRGESA